MLIDKGNIYGLSHPKRVNAPTGKQSKDLSPAADFLFEQAKDSVEKRARKTNPQVLCHFTTSG
jgi:hypothetical protein